MNPKSTLSYLLFSVLLLSTGVSYGQVKADFTANPVAGCAPLAVAFQDVSTGGPTAWKWDLGNGTVSFFQNPSTVYYIPGTYTVKLIVTTPAGVDSVVRQRYITVYGAPKPDFSASDTMGCFPLPVKFSDGTSSPDAPVNVWHWDFGDGDTSGLANPAHTYRDVGEFTVTLQVSTDKGCTQTVSKSRYIRIASGVKAGFTDVASASCKAPVDVQFTGQSSGPGVLSYNWDFGDGSLSTAENPVHSYTTNGAFSVILVTTSSAGCRDTVRKPGLINIGNIKVQFTSPETVCVGENFPLVNTSVPLPSSMKWDFGDGEVASVQAPFKSYAAPGVYTIKLVDIFQNCKDSAVKPIRVLARPVASFTTTDTYSCSVPFAAHFTADAVAGGAGSLYQWDFGDGSTGSGASAVHTYTSFGLFTVRLVVTGVNGCPDTLIRKDYINVQRPQITVSNLPAKGCLPLTITPAASVQVTDNVTEYRWDFGDGGTGTGANPSHTYTSEGVYTVRVFIKTAGGCMDSLVIPSAAQANVKPQVNFRADPPDVCRSVAVRFTNLSTPPGDQWQWSFGDGGKSAIQNPLHQYADTGYYNVTLVVWNKTCADTLTMDKLVHIDPPVARFAVGMDCINKYTRSFQDRSIGAKTWHWDMGDGTMSTEASPSHQYLQKGLYRVKLTVTNETCVDSTIQNIIIADEHPGFQVTVGELCKGTPAVFTLSGVDPVYTTGIVWDFGDGVQLAQTGAEAGAAGTLSHIYTKAGVYTVTLTGTDVNGCRTTVSQSQYIHINGPTADVEAPQKICINTEMEWKDGSVTDGRHALVEWTWDYGDGSVQHYSAPPFRHVYTKGGEYAIGLKVTDAYGCVDSIRKMAALFVSDPRAAFVASDTSTCPGKTVTFTNQSVASTGGGLNYQWDFGNGIRMPAGGPGPSPVSPVYTYPEDGLYQVALLAVDGLGCRISVTHTVRVSLPVARFELSDAFGTCPPLKVSFTNQSQNYVSLQWDFGDGSVSTLEAPVHFYNFPGTYQAKLLVRGPGGCEETMIKQIVVKGPQGSFTYTPLIGCKPLAVELKAVVGENASLIWDLNDGTTSTTTNTTLDYTYALAGSFLPKMILTDASGCRVAYPGKDTIQVIGVSSAADLDTYRVCDSGFVQFTDRSVANDFITKQEWRFGDETGPADGTVQPRDPRHFYKAPGVYTVWHKVTTAVGCTDELTMPDTIKVYQSPGASITGDSVSCVPGTLNFKAGTVIGDPALLSWKWDFGNGQTLSETSPGPQVYPVAGNYTVNLQVTFAGYCSSTAKRAVTIWPLPNTFAGDDTFECEGRPVLLHAVGADTLVWDPDPTLSCLKCADPLIDPMVNTTYTVTGTSKEGCVKKDSVNVRVRHPFAMEVLPGTTVCVGQSTLIGASGAEEYRWTPATDLDDPRAPVARATPAQTTTYVVVGSDGDHCFADTGKVLVTVFPIPTVSAGQDTTVLTGSTLQLRTINSPDVAEWNWQPGTGLSCTSCAAPKAMVTNSISYKVTVTNAGGCSAADTLTINSICNGGNFFIPNSFSPNGDGMNDVFYVRGKGLNNVQSMIIFNRWGQIVYERRSFAPNDPSAGWDGTYNGQKAPMDTYVYLIEIVCENSGIVPYRGNVTLLR